MGKTKRPKTDSTSPPKEKTLAVALRLERTYGPRPWRQHGDPIDVLVGTILSQNTSDQNTERAFSALRERFSSWDEVRTAPLPEVIAAIRSGGLANRKAPRIQGVLTAIADSGGARELDKLGGMAVSRATAWLTALDGVGQKTAACVLLFSFGLPAMPVDTHVHRVAARLGLIAPTISAERAHDHLLARLGGDAQRIYAFHMQMIAHGRAICTARQPDCPNCPLRDLCRFYEESRAQA